MPDLDKNVTTDENVEESNEVDASAGEKDSGKAEFSSLEEANAEVARLRNTNADIARSRDEKKEELRKIKDKQQAADDEAKKEQGRYKELYEAELGKNETLLDKLRKQSADTILSQELAKAGAVAVDTALPLVNRDKLVFDDNDNVTPESVVDAIAEVKEKHGLLFGGEKPQIPNPKRAGDGSSTDGYLDELDKLQRDPKATLRDLEALRRKFNIK